MTAFITVKLNEDKVGGLGGLLKTEETSENMTRMPIFWFSIMLGSLPVWEDITLHARDYGKSSTKPL